MKKIFTLLLVALCTLLVAAPVAAETKDVYVQYVVEEEYEWSLPSGTDTTPKDIDDGTTSNFDIEITKNVIGSGKKLKITVTSQNDWYLVDTADANNKLPYDATGDRGSWKTNSVIEVAAGTNTASSVANFSITKANPEKAGTYKDKLTFTSEVVSA